MKYLSIFQSASFAVAMSFLLSSCFLMDLGKSRYPPEEQRWIKKGWNSAQVKVELMGCYAQRKLPEHLILTVEGADAIDLCMLKKGFSPLPNPDRFRWLDPCELEPERALCRVYRGEVVVPPDQTALEIKPDPLAKPKPEVGIIECRRGKPNYEAAYCECSIPGPWPEGDPCAHLLKYKHRPIERSNVAPSRDPATQLQEQVQQDSNTQMNQLRITPAVPAVPSVSAPPVPNSRLDKLKQFKQGN